MKRTRQTIGNTTEIYEDQKDRYMPDTDGTGEHRIQKFWGRAKKLAVCAAYTFLCIHCFTVAAFATTESVTAPFTNLQSLAGSIVSAIGYIITLFGISEWGVSFGEAQGVMQAQSLKRIGGGFIMILAPQILTILTA